MSLMKSYRKIIFVLGITFVFIRHSFAQNDYINYHLAIDYAKKMTYENKPDSAIIYYKYAFSLVDYIYTNDLNKAQKLAKKTGDDSLVTFTQNKMDSYYKPDIYNSEYKRLVDSLSIEDQRIRGGKYTDAFAVYNEYINDSTSNKNDRKFIEAKVLCCEHWAVDSTNIAMLLVLIDSFGFPGERRITLGSYNNAFIILLHFDKDTGNIILKPILDKALAEGDLLPRDYAWIVDRRRAWTSKNPQLPYYFMPNGLDKLSEEEILEINQRRKAIGLRNLFEGVEIKHTITGSIIMNNLY